MIAENIWCRQCPIKNTCSPHLKPERIRANGTIDKNSIIWPRLEACRHFSCDKGQHAAAVAQGGQYGSYTVSDYNGLNTKTINAAPFGTDKPTHLEAYRIVDINTGEIYSKQEGIYYPTGQYSQI